MSYQVKDNFDIDEHFTNYCDLVYHVRPDQLPPIQLREVKTSFYGAFGMAIICVTETVKDKNFEEYKSIIDHLIKQVSGYMGTQFWNKEENGNK